MSYIASSHFNLKKRTNWGFNFALKNTGNRKQHPLCWQKYEGAIHRKEVRAIVSFLSAILTMSKLLLCFSDDGCILTGNCFREFQIMFPFYENAGILSCCRPACRCKRLALSFIYKVFPRTEHESVRGKYRNKRIMDCFTVQDPLLFHPHVRKDELNKVQLFGYAPFHMIATECFYGNSRYSQLACNRGVNAAVRPRPRIAKPAPADLACLRYKSRFSALPYLPVQRCRLCSGLLRFRDRSSTVRGGCSRHTRPRAFPPR